jgi:hypothetical protein
MKLSPESVDFACDRASAFSLLNANRPNDEKAESVAILMEGLGFTDSIKKRLNTGLNDLVDDGMRVPATGAIMFGVLIGLWIAEHAQEER